MITLRCIIDNSAARGTPLWGEHGVAFSVETPDGWLLFDTGQSGDVLVHNASCMGIPLERYDALVLSHAHYDHTGGLERFFSLCRSGISLYGNPDLFRERYTMKDGQVRSIGMRLSEAEVMQHAHLHLTAEPVEMLPGVWTTGEINVRQEFEGRSQQHRVRTDDTWKPDSYQDDLSLVLVASEGLVLLCGCCHAGLLNTLYHVRRHFSQEIRAIVGGTHLVNAGPETIDRTIEVLHELCGERLPDLYLNHCTGERAYIALAQAFGDRVHPCPAGTVLTFH